MNFVIIFINENNFNINEQYKIEKITYFINFNYFIIKSMSKKTSNTKLVFKKQHFITLIMFFTLLKKESLYIYIFKMHYIVN